MDSNMNESAASADTPMSPSVESEHHNLKNFGTKPTQETVQPTSPFKHTQISELYDEYKKFNLLKKKDDQMNDCPVGTEAYLVSRKWLHRYEKYICM